MKRYLISLGLICLLVLPLTGCKLNQKNVTQTKKSVYFYDEANISSDTKNLNIPDLNVLPARIIKDASQYAGFYKLDTDKKEVANLVENQLKVNEDGTFVELRVLRDDGIRYFVEEKNTLKETENKNYELLSGYLVESEGIIFLSYADAVHFYKSVNEKGSYAISPLASEYHYQTFKYTGFQMIKYSNNTFEADLGMEDGPQKFIKSDEPLPELSATPLEISNRLKNQTLDLSEGKYELNNENDFIQLFNRKLPNSEITLLKPRDYKKFETSDNGTQKAIYAFSTQDKNTHYVYLYDGERIYFSPEQADMVFTPYQF